MKSLLKHAYEAVPMKKEAFTLIKRFWRPDESIYKHLHFKGVFQVPVDGDHSFRLRHHGFQIENEIFWEGLQSPFERVSVGLWMRLARESRVIFDVGANTGVYGLVAKSLRPDAKVYAFEPIKRVYAKLSENVRLNNFDITCVEKAVSNADGTATIYDPQTEHVLAVTVGKNRHPPDVKVVPITIETVRLDTFIKEQGLERLDLMKLDVETHEPEALSGMGEYLQRFQPTMLVEILNDEVGRRVEEVVRDKGYLYFNINDRADSIRRTTHIMKSDYFNYLLCTEEKARALGLM